MSINKIGAEVRMLYPELSKNEQRLVDFFFSLPVEHIGVLKLKEIALSNNVSQSAIVKLAKHIGFSGFKEFKLALMEYAVSLQPKEEREVNSDDNAKSIMRKIINTSVQSLEETFTIMNTQDFEDAAYYLAKARSRYFYGLGGSSMIAGDAYHKFQRAGLKSEYSNDANTMIIQASLMNKDDVVLAVSHSGNSNSLVQAIMLAKRNGAKIIAITNYRLSKLARISNVVLCSTALCASCFVGEEAAARIVKLSIIDGIFIMIAQLDEEKFTRNLKISGTLADRICRR